MEWNPWHTHVKEVQTPQSVTTGVWGSLHVHRVLGESRVKVIGSSSHVCAQFGVVLRDPQHHNECRLAEVPRVRCATAGGQLFERGLGMRQLRASAEPQQATERELEHAIGTSAAVRRESGAEPEARQSELEHAVGS